MSELEDIFVDTFVHVSENALLFEVPCGLLQGGISLIDLLINVLPEVHHHLLFRPFGNLPDRLFTRLIQGMQFTGQVIDEYDRLLRRLKRDCAQNKLEQLMLPAEGIVRYVLLRFALRHYKMFRISINSVHIHHSPHLAVKDISATLAKSFINYLSSQQNRIPEHVYETFLNANSGITQTIKRGWIGVVGSKEVSNAYGQSFSKYNLHVLSIPITCTSQGDETTLWANKNILSQQTRFFVRQTWGQWWKSENPDPCLQLLRLPFSHEVDHFNGLDDVSRTQYYVDVTQHLRKYALDSYFFRDNHDVAGGEDESGSNDDGGDNGNVPNDNGGNAPNDNIENNPNDGGGDGNRKGLSDDGVDDENDHNKFGGDDGNGPNDGGGDDGNDRDDKNMYKRGWRQDVSANSGEKNSSNSGHKKQSKLLDGKHLKNHKDNSTDLDKITRPRSVCNIFPASLTDDELLSEDENIVRHLRRLQNLNRSSTLTVPPTTRPAPNSKIDEDIARHMNRLEELDKKRENTGDTGLECENDDRAKEVAEAFVRLGWGAPKKVSGTDWNTCDPVEIVEKINKLRREVVKESPKWPGIITKELSLFVQANNNSTTENLEKKLFMYLSVGTVVGTACLAAGSLALIIPFALILPLLIPFLPGIIENQDLMAEKIWNMPSINQDAFDIIKLALSIGETYKPGPDEIREELKTIKWDSLKVT